MPYLFGIWFSGEGKKYFVKDSFPQQSLQLLAIDVVHLLLPTAEEQDHFAEFFIGLWLGRLSFLPERSEWRDTYDAKKFMIG